MKINQPMTREVWTRGPGDSLNAAARIMWDRDCGCVPVIEREDVTDAQVAQALEAIWGPRQPPGVATAA